MAKWLLNNWQFICQLTAPTQDGHYSENAADDCGETCDTMIERWSHNIYVSPDAINDYLYGQGHVGYGYVSDLSHWLNTRGFQTAYANVAFDEAMYRYTGALKEGSPSILLLYADRASHTGGHFETTIGFDGDLTTDFANPWTGTRERIAKYQLADWYNGWVITTDAKMYQKPYTAPIKATSAGVKGASAGAQKKPPLAQHYTVKAGHAVIVGQASVGLKAKPNHTSPALATLKQGMEVKANNWYSTDANREQWINVQWTDKTGWVPVKNLHQ